MKLVLFALLLSSNAFAADLSSYLDQQLTMMETSGAQQLPAPQVSPDDDSAFFLKRFWLRVRPKAIFSLPGVVKLQVIPELEMLWERPTPEGWTGYKK